MKKIGALLFASLTVLFGCGGSVKNSSEEKSVANQATTARPAFNADSAYHYIDAQVAFGPRVPDSKSHEKCATYLANSLERMGADVLIQEGEVVLFNKKRIACKNIIGQFDKSNPNRIVLFSHWDSRPFADMERDEALRMKPIDGASDGASGVGVLMEIARLYGKSKASIGIDIVFLDVEDYGQPHFVKSEYQENSWCLGAQFWANNLNKSNYMPRYGILLDMVGAKDALFYKEGYSMQYAPQVVEKVWQTAASLGYGSRFVYDMGGTITDDHVYVNSIAGIPTIDIIQYDPSSSTSFGTYWHTHQDNMSIIDKGTLTAVGETLLEIIYTEK